MKLFKPIKETRFSAYQSHQIHHMDAQLKKPSTNSVGNWSTDEDEIILQYVYEKGKLDEHMMWGNLSDTLNGRSGKSCRERWFNHLDPKIKRTEWS